MIKRVGPTDAKKVAGFLQKTFEEDALSQGEPALQTKDAVEARCKEAAMFACIENGKVVGMMQRFDGGVMEMWGEFKTFYYHNLLAVDYDIYKTNIREAIRIARELCLESANDVRGNNQMRDLIVVDGPSKSRGADWCRLLKMSEIPMGDWSRFVMPLELIWDRLKETEKL